MTATHLARPLPAPSLTAALGSLRARGMRVSAARRLVLEALFASERPLSAEEIAGGLDGRLPPSDLASVYRNLDTLEAAGLVHHLHLGHGPGRYVLVRDGARGFLACERCGGHAVLDDGALDAVRDAVRTASGFEVRLRHFPLIGTCPACAGRV